MGAPKLTDSNIEKAVRLLDAWQGKLTWDHFLAVLSVEVGHKYTKMAMHKQPRIMQAWELAKARTREGNPGVPHGNVAVVQARKRVQELEARVERLELENRNLLEQFMRWAHNAVRLGLGPQDLDRPLRPRPEKGKK